MTAEVAVLNRNAVALAADSAVTLRLPEGLKVYYTNKLFALSKYEPIAVMLYGNADFLEVPWETIIKAYRLQLGKRSCGTVQEYGDDFVGFVTENSGLFPERAQDNSCYWWTRYWLRRIKNNLKTTLEKRHAKKGSLNESDVKTLLKEVLERERSHLKRHSVLSTFKGVSLSVMRTRCSPSIRQAVIEELKKLADVAVSAGIVDLAIHAIRADAYWHGESGIVVAGFGRTQFFPSLRSYRADSLIAGRLRVEEDMRSADISIDNRAAVIAFAQSEMVALFMNGIDREYESLVTSFVNHSLSRRYPELVLHLINKYLPKRGRSSLLKRLRAVGEKLAAALSQGMDAYSREIHSDPIVEIVAHLPKEELAAMAEALVNLTSFKRHVTRQAETVGGPIDVAIISKGDGLIWMKRKHYFQPKLNPQFFSNYYRSVGEKNL